jgi:hypothetical protein
VRNAGLTISDQDLIEAIVRMKLNGDEGENSGPFSNHNTPGPVQQGHFNCRRGANIGILIDRSIEGEREMGLEIPKLRPVQNRND